MYPYGERHELFIFKKGSGVPITEVAIATPARISPRIGTNAPMVRLEWFTLKE